MSLFVDALRNGHLFVRQLFPNKSFFSILIDDQQLFAYSRLKLTAAPRNHNAFK